MSVNGTLVEDKMRAFKGECAQFSFNKFPIYTHDDASAKFITNSQEKENSAVNPLPSYLRFSHNPISFLFTLISLTNLKTTCLSAFYVLKTPRACQFSFFHVNVNTLRRRRRVDTRPSAHHGQKSIFSQHSRPDLRYVLVRMLHDKNT